MSGTGQTSAAASPLLRIGELVERTGVPAATLRSWQRRHGLVPSRRTSGNQRLYPEDAVEVVREVQRLHGAGTPLSEVARCLAQAQDEPVPPMRVAAGPAWLEAQVQLREAAGRRLRELVQEREAIVAARDSLLRQPPQRDAR